MAQPGYCLIGLLVMLTGPRVKQAYCRGGGLISPLPSEVQLLGLKARNGLFLYLFVHLCVFPHSPRTTLRFDEMMSVTFLLCRQSTTDEGNTVLLRGSLVCY